MNRNNLVIDLNATKIHSELKCIRTVSFGTPSEKDLSANEWYIIFLYFNAQLITRVVV